MRRGLFQHALYANGNLGKSGLASLLEIYGLFYLTDILNLSPALAGAVLLSSLIWDAVTDPIIGYISDRLRHRLKTATVYFAAGAPLTAAAFVGIFLSDKISLALLPTYILLVSLMFRTAYTIVDIPHNSLLAFLSDTPADRTNIASLRIFFSSVGRFLVMVAAASVFGEANEAASAVDFRQVAIFMACVYLASIGLSLLAVRAVRFQSAVSRRFYLRDVFRLITRNKNLSIVFALSALNSLTIPIIGAAIVYGAKYGLGDEAIGARAMAFFSVAQALSLIVWSWATNASGRKASTAKIAYGMIAGGVLLLAVLGCRHALPLFLSAIVIGGAVGGVFMLNWSMLPDALDAASKDVAFGREMSIFGVYTLTNKVFAGLSQASFGLVLSCWGYSPDALVATTHINEIVITALGLPFVGVVACIFLLNRYNDLGSLGAANQTRISRRD